MTDGLIPRFFIFRKNDNKEYKIKIMGKNGRQSHTS
jgi:hypothetical protein